ncbi:MAG: tripartite tricarboxylate transporter substrate binding protein [Alcaligenaceae bacterium]|nr:tripartite tricarboxylate transporter substrate binding protein [Alcaligenaceae bacterium SAGV5]MPS54414.1 tripartite tricarboxylate transporter substrate binding protein [Alcaligenaceae bacterium SAGV3]MPT58554.1 tripartite tricarboxylate transporter substrate binding protein [Alcaligenaceae bacterium]
MAPWSVWAGYPERPIRLVLPVAPGGGTDIVSRIVAEKLAAGLGQSVIVENRGGAGGNIAAEMVARAKPDGYTLLVVTASHATNPNLYRNLPFDTLKDFIPITQLTSQPYLFVVNPQLPVKSVPQFVAYAKKTPGVTYASSGSGLLGHLGMEQLKMLAGFDAIHVPYKGASPALVDTIAGHTQAFFPTVVSGLPFVRDGKVRVIGVTSSKRLSLLPDVPTVAEAGYPDYSVYGWYGLLAPAGTPKEIIDRLHDETVKVLGMADVRAKIAADGAEPIGSTPEQFDAYIRSEMERWGVVIKQSGARVD